MNNLTRNVLIVLGIIFLLTATTALTITVKTELEASGIIGTVKPIITGKCEVTDIVKEIRSAGNLTNLDNPYIVSYTLEYIVNGERDFLMQQLKTNNISTKSLEGLVKKDCESLKAKIELEGKRVDRVIIRPDNNIYNKLYDLATGKWVDK